MHIGIVGLERVSDLLENGRLAGFGRRNDHSALATPDRRDEVDDASGQVRCVPLHLEAELAVGEKRSQILEARPLARFFWRETGNRIDADEGGVLLARAGDRK